MTPRLGRLRTGGQRIGLFTFTDNGDVEPEELEDNPLRRPCPTCHSAIGQPCTRPARRVGRIRINSYHDARKTPEDPK